VSRRCYALGIMTILKNGSRNTSCSPNNMWRAIVVMSSRGRERRRRISGFRAESHSERRYEYTRLDGKRIVDEVVAVSIGKCY